MVRSRGLSDAQLVAAIDLGSAVLRGGLGVILPEGGVKVVAQADAASAGIKAGGVCEPDALGEAILGVVKDLNRQAGGAVTHITFAYGGADLVSLRLIGRTSLGGPVAAADMLCALAAARRSGVPTDCALLHAPVLGYAIDDIGGVRDPRGRIGDTLAAMVHGIALPRRTLRTLHAVAGKAGVTLESVSAQPMAGALAALTMENKRAGVLLIDCGAGATRASVVVPAGLAHVASVPYGGAHVTADLAHGLSLDPAACERLKRDGDGNAAAIAAIAAPRVEEIFELLRAALISARALELGVSRIVLMGRAARLSGLAALAEHAFALPVVGADIPADDAIVQGALALAAEARARQTTPHQSHDLAAPWIASLSKLARSAKPWFARELPTSASRFTQQRVRARRIKRPAQTPGHAKTTMARTFSWLQDRF